MKTVKMFQAAILIFVIAVIAGCSDQITSSGEPYVKSSNKGSIEKVDQQVDKQVFHSKIRLKPGSAYTFNYVNTGLVNFYSIDAKRNYPEAGESLNTDHCKDIEVSSNDVGLNCQSSNLNLKEITIRNISSTVINVNVELRGSKPPVKKNNVE